MSSSTAQNFTCDMCGTSFGTREELREHSIKSHAEEKVRETATTAEKASASE